MAVIPLPKEYPKRLRSTDMQERLNKDIRRREGVIHIFPNDDSALRLIVALLAEHNESWQKRKYVDMEEFREWLQHRPPLLRTTTLLPSLAKKPFVTDGSEKIYSKFRT